MAWANRVSRVEAQFLNIETDSDMTTSYTHDTVQVTTIHTHANLHVNTTHTHVTTCQHNSHT